jgi:glycosyltransferase involved in cell wall biosynthesis
VTGQTGMRIAYVLGTSGGGTGAHVAMLAAGCASRGMTVRVFGPLQTGRRFFPGQGVIPESGGPRGGGIAGGRGGPASAGGTESWSLGPGVFVPVEIADRPRPARDLAAVMRLRRLLRRWSPDVIHAHGLRAGTLAALARPAGGALVVTVHNAPVTGGVSGIIYAVLERIVCRRADAVTWVSADLGARMRRRGGRDGGRALVPAPPARPPSPEEIAKVRAELGGDGRPVVLAVGRLAPQKGFGTLLAAAARWRDRVPQPAVVIAGEGPLAGPLADQARSAGVTVRFLGPRDDVPTLLAAADVVAVPSVWEGQPLIVQEALRAGTPLVAARVGGIPELTGEDAAILVPPGDPAALGDAVVSLLGDPGNAAKVRSAGRERAAGLPSLQDAIDAVAGLYVRLAGPAG